MMADRIYIAVIAAAIAAAPMSFLCIDAALAGETGVRMAQAATGKSPPLAPGKNNVAAPKTARDVGATGSLGVPGDIVGVWMTDDGLGAVEIAPCGDKRCGRIVWMKNPFDAKGRIQADVNNPNAALRTRPVCGVEIITGLARQADQSWDVGKIYDPKEGDDHDLAAKLKGPNELEITGYEGTKWLSETFLWKRAPAELSRCDQMQAGMTR
jgi:uncharacterized protein (DUF2147 family)